MYAMSQQKKLNEKYGNNQINEHLSNINKNTEQSNYHIQLYKKIIDSSNPQHYLRHPATLYLSV
ncbi:hypothetical protein SAMN05216302_103423 [Nitrosomonas aestuarii]|uniref:Uncharacterized protein n=1 Tax=Nitrosomonas aestuarii TaxID=52441 RepID=A0A1I4F9A9_9PROT|nr:hypothetical protein SAMN05216302_103423 [Nitrosomonas aestuarii]